jgi:hypothetical protein
LNIELMILLFNLKETRSFNCKNWFQCLKTKKCDLAISMRRPLHIADSKKPTQTMAKSFPAFAAGNQCPDF